MRTALALLFVCVLATASIFALWKLPEWMREEVALVRVADRSSAPPRYQLADPDAPVADAPFPPDPDDADDPDDAAAATDAGRELEPVAPAGDPASSEPLVAPAARIIGGPGISPGPTAAGPLVREAVPPPPPERARWRTYPRVLVAEPAVLDVGRRRFHLAYVVAPEAEAKCRAGTGTPELSCAQLSLQALRRRVRALGVQCEAPGDTGAEAVVPCRIGKTDLSLWLVEQGWASAAADAPEGYGEAERRARCARAGIWQSAEAPAGCAGR